MSKANCQRRIDDARRYVKECAAKGTNPIERIKCVGLCLVSLSLAIYALPRTQQKLRTKKPKRKKKGPRSRRTGDSIMGLQHPWPNNSEERERKDWERNEGPNSMCRS